MKRKIISLAILLGVFLFALQPAIAGNYAKTVPTRSVVNGLPVLTYTFTFVGQTDTVTFALPGQLPKFALDTMIVAANVYTIHGAAAYDSINVNWKFQWSSDNVNWQTTGVLGYDSTVTTGATTKMQTTLVGTKSTGGVQPYYRLILYGVNSAGIKTEAGIKIKVDFVLQSLLW